MKRMSRMVATVVSLGVLAAGSVAVAQTRPMTPGQPSHEHGQADTPAPGRHSHQPMMGQGMMMCPMMGHPMMGMSDPKAQARMMRLRGDMMKAMGDVLLKHAQEMEQAK